MDKPDVPADPERPLVPADPDIPDDPLTPDEPAVTTTGVTHCELLPSFTYMNSLPDVRSYHLSPELGDVGADDAAVKFAVPSIPDVPADPEEPLVPADPLAPLVPDVPDDPEVPDVPADPDRPLVPADPEVPAEPLAPIMVSLRTLNDPVSPALFITR
jgi:hypothetical protein